MLPVNTDSSTHLPGIVVPHFERSRRMIDISWWIDDCTGS